MRGVWTLLVLFAVPGGWADQGQGVLRISVTLIDAAPTPTPIQRHVLLVSDNPATREPRRILTAADGTAVITLPPGSYIVESERPATLGGRAYQWTQVIEIAAGRDAVLALTAGNAEIVAAPASPAAGNPASRLDDPSSLLVTWQGSVVAVWTPTARASGFLVDQRGLIATDHRAVGTATLVEVQLSPTLKVPARVLSSARSRDAAILWVDPSLVAASSSLPLPCPPAAAPPLDDGQEIAAIAAPHQAQKEVVHGDVTALQPRRVETDLRLPFGGVGGPVFNDAGVVAGLTSVAADADGRRPGDVAIVRTVFICEALGAARPRLSGETPPEPTRLPVDDERPFPIGALDDAPQNDTVAAAPPVLSTSDFDVAFLTPPMVHRERQRSGRTGGVRGRSPEAEARLGRLVEFGSWSEYFASMPAVLIVRVTPKLVEGFWKRLGREAARTQGAVLPPFKDFKTSFLRLRATCGSAEVTPIHPFVLEHRVSDKAVIREGLYVFGPEALGPHCGTVTLSLYAETMREKAETLTIRPSLIEQIWQDFEPSRASAR